MWDAGHSASRSVQGFHTKDELALLINRRTATFVRCTNSTSIPTLPERYYQERGDPKIAESFDEGHRKALLVMATGAGEARTTIALVDLLMRANLVKRVLFLADRTALVNQAVGAFVAHLPNSDPVNLVTERNTDGRVYVSTYQTMIGLIDEFEADGTRRFGVGRFDLVVIDKEAHRSVYKKYRGIFEYFDSYLVGLTATPRTRSTRTPTTCSTSKPACPPARTRLRKQSRTGISFRPRRTRCRSNSFAKGSGTTISPRKKKENSGTTSSGATKTATRPTAGVHARHQPVAVQRRHRRQSPRET